MQVACELIDEGGLHGTDLKSAYKSVPLLPITIQLYRITVVFQVINYQHTCLAFACRLEVVSVLKVFQSLNGVSGSEQSDCTGIQRWCIAHYDMTLYVNVLCCGLLA